MTLPSRHRIRYSSTDGLRPSSFLGHGGSPQYWFFTSELVRTNSQTQASPAWTRSRPISNALFYIFQKHTSVKRNANTNARRLKVVWFSCQFPEGNTGISCRNRRRISHLLTCCARKRGRPGGSFVSTGACNLEVPGSNPIGSDIFIVVVHVQCSKLFKCLECTVLPMVLCTIKSSWSHPK